MHLLLTIVRMTCFLHMAAIFLLKHQISHITSYLKIVVSPYFLQNSSLFTYLPAFSLRKTSVLWAHLASLSLFPFALVLHFPPLYSQISILPPPGNGERTKLNCLPTVCQSLSQIFLHLFSDFIAEEIKARRGYIHCPTHPWKSWIVTKG